MAGSRAFNTQNGKLGNDQLADAQASDVCLTCCNNSVEIAGYSTDDIALQVVITTRGKNQVNPGMADAGSVMTQERGATALSAEKGLIEVTPTWIECITRQYSQDADMRPAVSRLAEFLSAASDSAESLPAA